MSHFPETAAAWRRVKFNLRASLCELFASWAIRVAPDGYVPSYVKACVDAYHHRGPFEQKETP